ncbi:hypothetical protein TNCV_76721 [Trichonephila clavipes]|nr:hypothetical protein TNCV_76721 [Trichonephila clavipes]
MTVLNQCRFKLISWKRKIYRPLGTGESKFITRKSAPVQNQSRKSSVSGPSAPLRAPDPWAPAPSTQWINRHCSEL